MNLQRFSKYSMPNASTPGERPLQRGTDTSAQSPSRTTGRLVDHGRRARGTGRQGCPRGRRFTAAGPIPSDHPGVSRSAAPLEQLGRQHVGRQRIPVLMREVEIEGAENELDLGAGGVRRDGGIPWAIAGRGPAIDNSASARVSRRVCITPPWWNLHDHAVDQAPPFRFFMDHRSPLPVRC